MEHPVVSRPGGLQLVVALKLKSHKVVYKRELYKRVMDTGQAKKVV